MLETERDEIIQYGIEREKIILVSIAIILGLGCVFDIFYLSITQTSHLNKRYIP